MQAPQPFCCIGPNSWNSLSLNIYTVLIDLAQHIFSGHLKLHLFSSDSTAMQAAFMGGALLYKRFITLQ